MKFVIGLLAAVALLSVSCEKTKEAATKKNPYDGTKMTFTLAMNKVESNSAEIRVRYTADKTLNWYYYVSDDMESSIEDLVDDGVSLIDKSTSLEKLKSKVIAVSDLEVETDYRFVVFGVDREDDGTIWTYGTPAEISFKTSKDLNVIFSATEPVVERNSVKFTVSYDVDEDAEYTWYAHLTKTISGTTANVIKSEIKNIPADQLKSGKDVEINLTGLDFSTTYRIIVTGLLADGTTYGTAADFTFNTEDKFYEESSWSIAYDGKVWRSSYNIYSLDFSVSTSNSPHMFACYTAEEFAAQSVADHIEFEYADVADYISGSSSATWSNFVQTTDVGWYGAYNGVGNYVALIYGLEQKGDDYVLTGGYKTFAFAVSASSGADAAYEAWCGEWIVGDDKWTISSYDPGISLQITGVCGVEESIKTLAIYNNGTIYLSEQYVTGVVDAETSAGTIPARLKLMGLFPYQGSNAIWGGSAQLFSAKISSGNPNQAIITPSKPSSSYSAFTGCMFYYEPTEDSSGTVYRYGSATACLWSSKTMDRPEEPSEAYLAWIGNWEVKRPEYTAESQRGKGDNEPTGEFITDTWTITEKVTNKSYIITGLDKYDVEAIAEFNSETGAIEVSEQYLTSVNNNGTTYLVYLMGLYKEEGDEDFSIWGGSEKIFSATIGAGGVASAEPFNLDDSYTSSTTGETVEVHGVFVGMEAFSVNGTTGDLANFLADNWYEFYRFPCTFNKAASSPTSFTKTSFGRYSKFGRSASASRRPSITSNRTGSLSVVRPVRMASGSKVKIEKK